jgi:hypothetical protein
MKFHRFTFTATATVDVDFEQFENEDDAFQYAYEWVREDGDCADWYLDSTEVIEE